MGKLTISMGIFNSYVKLPEGTIWMTGWLDACRIAIDRYRTWKKMKKKHFFDAVELADTWQIHDKSWQVVMVITSKSFSTSAVGVASVSAVITFGSATSMVSMPPAAHSAANVDEMSHAAWTTIKTPAIQ